MSLPALDNLVRIGQLKAEPRNEAEARRMLAMARTRLEDARLTNLSIEGRFTSAYNAAHAAALTAASLAWLSQRKPIHRVPVPHASLNWPAPRWRVLDAAHQKRNLAEYEGFLEVDEAAITELCDLAGSLIAEVSKVLE